MNSRAWAFTAMICALLLGAPTSLADEGGDDLFTLLDPVTDPIEDTCASMLQVTLVSFGGKVDELESQALHMETLVKGQLHTTIHTVEEVWHYPAELTQELGLKEAVEPVAEVAGPAFMELVEVTKTTVEEVDVPTPIHVEWSREEVTWERIERTTLVPLPADLSGVDPTNIVTACDEESFQVEAPYYGGDYDVFMVGWWPEQFAPETPENDEYIRITDLTLGVEPAEDVEPLTLDQGFVIAPNDVEHAVLEAIAEHAPIVYETITEDEEPEEESEEEIPEEGEDSEEAEAGLETASQGVPLAAKASIGGGLGVAGLVGTLLALRRR